MALAAEMPMLVRAAQEVQASAAREARAAAAVLPSRIRSAARGRERSLQHVPQQCLRGVYAYRREKYSARAGEVNVCINPYLSSSPPGWRGVNNGGAPGSIATHASTTSILVDV
jgi:hypothetical protein